MTTQSGPAAGGWLQSFSPNTKAGVRLFCFPYAGGNAAVYRGWSRKLPAGVELLAVQLPGRAGRMHEPPVSELPRLVDTMAPSLAPHCEGAFAFFGHSMGAMIAFELARRLRREGRALPLHVFVSGRSAPQLNRSHKLIHNLPEPELIEELKHLNGTPREVLEHPELMELMLPILRADFSVCDTYEYREEPPLDCPITAFGGLQDSGVPRANLEAWREQTSAAFMLRMLPGDHFFLHSNESLLLRLLASELHRPAGR
jgi:medium-chain acyl-[acyl-carrier-protein] hydrolase